jgi:four helix bundle protein
VSIERFEELRSWQEARKLVRLIYSLSDKPIFKKDFELRHQTRAAAVSAMGNVAEAHGRFTFEDKRNFYEVSHGSLAELQSHLYVALDNGYVSPEEFQEAYGCADTVGKLIKGSIDNLTRQIGLRRRDSGKGR